MDGETRYTEAVCRILISARSCALARGSDLIFSNDIAYSMLENTHSADLLSSLGVDISQAKDRVRATPPTALPGNPSIDQSSRARYGQRAKDVLRYAERFAASRQEDVRPLHIVHGFIDERKSMFSNVLISYGVNSERIERLLNQA